MALQEQKTLTVKIPDIPRDFLPLSLITNDQDKFFFEIAPAPKDKASFEQWTRVILRAINDSVHANISEMKRHNLFVAASIWFGKYRQRFMGEM